MHPDRIKELVSYGFALHPLRWDKKSPASANGFHDATRNLKELMRTCISSANVGISCRDEVGGLDIDNHEGKADGWPAYHELCEKYGEIVGPRSLTPNRGMHIFFRFDHTAGRSLIAKPAPGIDCPNYVVAPFSKVNGKEYVWDSGAHPADVPLAPLPKAWFEFLTTKAPSEQPKSTGDASQSSLGRRFRRAGLLGHDLGNGRAAVRCPWAGAHSHPEQDSPSTSVLFAPKPGGSQGRFHCSHAGCARLNRDVALLKHELYVIEASKMYRRTG